MTIIQLSIFHTHSIFLEREKGDEAVLKLSDLASLSDGVFKDRFVHFNSCRTFLRFREVEHLVIEVFRFLAGEAVVFTPELTGVKDIVTQADIERELAKVPEKEKAAFLEQYAETYVQMHVDRIVEENYRRIKADIGDIFEAHGVVLAVDDAETPENGNDPDETHEAKHQFPEDGIAEEEVPETEPVLPVDEEWEE